jgi:hypothetical protein
MKNFNLLSPMLKESKKFKSLSMVKLTGNLDKRNFANEDVKNNGIVGNCYLYDKVSDSLYSKSVRWAVTRGLYIQTNKYGRVYLNLFK